MASGRPTGKFRIRGKCRTPAPDTPEWTPHATNILDHASDGTGSARAQDIERHWCPGQRPARTVPPRRNASTRNSGRLATHGERAGDQLRAARGHAPDRPHRRQSLRVPSEGPARGVRRWAGVRAGASGSHDPFGVGVGPVPRGPARRPVGRGVAACHQRVVGGRSPSRLNRSKGAGACRSPRARRAPIPPRSPCALR